MDIQIQDTNLAARNKKKNNLFLSFNRWAIYAGVLFSLVDFQAIVIVVSAPDDWWWWW